MTSAERRPWKSPKSWLQFLAIVACFWVVGLLLTGTTNGAFVIAVLVIVFGLCGLFFT
jgi:hypothetical protein